MKPPNECNQAISNAPANLIVHNWIIHATTTTAVATTGTYKSLAWHFPDEKCFIINNLGEHQTMVSTTTATKKWSRQQSKILPSHFLSPVLPSSRQPCNDNDNDNLFTH